MNLNKLFTLFILLSLCFVACDDNDDDNTPTVATPETYNFDPMDFSGQTARLDMLAEMTAYMKTGNTSGTVLDEATLLNMYRNENAPFVDAGLNTTTKQLKDKTFELEQNQIEEYISKIAQASQSTTPGSNGVAGVVTSNSGEKSYLLDENGIEYTQLIEKGLMGACFYFQMTSVYLSDDKLGALVDNEIVVEGKGTDMQHHWDEAFGYWGTDTDFFMNENATARFIGKYSNSRNAVLNTNETIMNAFIDGRVAIAEKDLTKRDEQIDIIRAEVEKVFAGTGIHYLNSAIADITDDALRCHVLSEAVAFIDGLRYNEAKIISSSQIDEILNILGTNFYDISIEDINAAKNQLSSIYGLDNVKDIL